MTDREVLSFCRDGYLMLPGVVESDVNEAVMAFCERGGAEGPSDDNWYVDNVTLNPVLMGVIRSLLGADFGYFPFTALHRTVGATEGQKWHRDGGATSAHVLDCLQVFYLPQETTLAMGPTELLPSSHLYPVDNRQLAHYGQLRGAVDTQAPAGSFFVTAYGIWHRRMRTTSSATRNLLKFWYVRTAAPKRDWIHSDHFSVTDAVQMFPTETFGRERHSATNAVADLFYWLAGQSDLQLTLSTSNLPVYFAPSISRHRADTRA
jgi:hypothetical protein